MSLFAEVTEETREKLRDAFTAYEDDQLEHVIGLERFQRSALTKLAHWVSPDPECDHCYHVWAEWAASGEGPFTRGQLEYWDTSEVTSGFERRLLLTIEALRSAMAKVSDPWPFTQSQWDALP